MKQLLALGLSLSLAVCCAGCGPSTANNPAPSEQPAVSSYETASLERPAVSSYAPTVSGQMVQPDLPFTIPVQDFCGPVIEEEYTMELISTYRKAQEYYEQYGYDPRQDGFDEDFFETHSIVGLVFCIPGINPYSIGGVMVEGDTLTIGVYETWAENQTVAALGRYFRVILSLSKDDIQGVTQPRLVFNRITFPEQQ